MDEQQTSPTEHWTQRLGQRLSDMVNPIAVKEMRQAVSGRIITGVIVLFLVVQTAAVALYMLMRNASGESFGEGAALFGLLMAILLGTCMLFVPASTAFRMNAERNEANVDLMFITTLRPWRIISGKFVSAIVMALLVYALCLPYLTLAYLLRGVDLLTMGLLTGMSLVVVAWCVMFAILVASVTTGRLLRSLAQLLTLVLFFYIFGMATMIGGDMLVGFGGVPAEMWWITLGFAAGSGLLMFSLAVAAVSPAMSNRAVLPRAVGAVLLVVVLVVVLVVASAGTPTARFSAGMPSADWWASWAVLGLGFALLTAISERDGLNRRLEAAVPRNLLGRLAAFFFFSGAASGIAWVVVAMAATVATTYAVDARGAQEVEALALYLLAYGLVAFIVARRTPLARVMNPTHTFAVALVLAAVGSVWPLFAAVTTGGMFMGEIPNDWWITAVWAGYAMDQVETPLIAGRVMAAALLAVLTPWWLSRVNAFGPLRSEKAARPAVAEAAVAEPAEGSEAALQPAVATEEVERG